MLHWSKIFIWIHGIILFWLCGETCIFGAPVRVSPTASFEQRLKAAYALLEEVPLILGSNDLASNLRHFQKNKDDSNYFSTSQKIRRNDSFLMTTTDYLYLKRGKVDAQLWSTNVPCESQYLNSVQLLMEQVDLIRKVISSHKDSMTLANSSKAILDAFHSKTLASIVTVEGGHSLGSSMGVIRSLYELGVRSLTLTHKCHTPWAECSKHLENQANARGLTPFGKGIGVKPWYELTAPADLLSSGQFKHQPHITSLTVREIVIELNRLGMLIDLSHSSDYTARDVISLSEAPVIFSHSGATSICDVSDNVPDDVISSLALNGGILMISFDKDLLTCGKNVSISDIVVLINHIRSMAGVDHVGLGSGIDGINSFPRDFKDASFYPDLFAELLKDPSWSIQDLKKLAGLNFLRVFSKVEDVRDQMSSFLPSEEIIPIHDIDSRWPCRYKFSNINSTTRS